MFSEPLPPTHTLTHSRSISGPDLPTSAKPLTLPPALPPSEDRPASPGAAGPSPSRRCPGGGQEAGERCALKVATNTACKLLGCSPAHALSGTVPQRRALPQGLPGWLAPRGKGGGGRVARVPATFRRRPIETPAPVPVTGAYPNATPPPPAAGATSSHGRSDGAASVPAGTWGGEAGARHPAGGGGSLRGSQPLYLRRAALRTDQRRSTWRTGSAPAGLSRGRVVSGVLGVVGGGRGEPRAGHSADQGAESRHGAPGSGSLACQLQLGFKRLPVSSSRGGLALGGGA